MKRNVTALFSILALNLMFSISAHAGNGGLRVLVTPSGKSGSMRCQVGSEPSPEGQWRWRVTVEGGHGPYHWRLPLYNVDRGENRIAAAQIGTALLDAKRSFLVEVASQEIQQKSKDEVLNLEISTDQGMRAHCSAPLVRQTSAVEVEPLQASAQIE